jgi:hypothetical protein
MYYEAQNRSITVESSLAEIRRCDTYHLATKRVMLLVLVI